MAAGPLARVVVPPLLGLAADRRRGPRFWSVVAAWGALCGVLLMWAPGGLPLLYAGAVVYSLFNAPSMPLLDAMTLGRAAARFGHVRMWGSVGYVLTSFTLGTLFPSLPPEVIIASTAGSLLLFSLFLSATRIEDAPTPRTDWGELPRVLRGRAVWLLLAALLLSRMAAGPLSGFYIIFVNEQGLGGDVVALTWGIAIATEVCVMLGVDRLINRFGPGRVLAAGVLLDALRWLFYSLVATKAALLAVAPAHGLAFAMLYVAGVRALTAIIPREFRALGQGLGAAAQAVGLAAGLILAGYVYKTSGSRVMFAAAGIVGLASTACALAFTRLDGRDNG
jgi:PPP family 3-phenylpropionic acid transporter